MNFQEIWNSIVNFFKTNGWNILLFFAVLLIGIIVVKIVMNMTKRILNKSKMEKIAQNFICAIIKLALYLILVLIILSIIGIQITGIVTALSALLLAVGMALQNNISNLANGIVIVSTRMFKKGDYISVDGVEGSITEINFLFTTLITPDNKKITLPNSTIVNNSVTNSGANDKRRVDFTFAVAYESDIEQVKKIVIDVMKSDGRVYLDPAPFCRLKTLADSSINFFANCWVDTVDYWDVYYYIIENVYNEFKRNNISIPYNQIEVRERKDVVNMPVIETPLQERQEKVRQAKKNHFDLENVDITKVFKHKSIKQKESKQKRKQAKLDKKMQKQQAKALKNNASVENNETNALQTIEKDKKE